MFALDLLAIRARAQLAIPLRAQRRRRTLSDESERARKLDNVESVRIHAC